VAFDGAILGPLDRVGDRVGEAGVARRVCPEWSSRAGAVREPRRSAACATPGVLERAVRIELLHILANTPTSGRPKAQASTATRCAGSGSTDKASINDDPALAVRLRSPCGEKPLAGIAESASGKGAKRCLEGAWPQDPTREALERDQAQPVRGVPRAFLGTSVHANVAGCVRY
jgi:hypothetical protein